MKREIGEGGVEREDMYLVVVGRSKYIFVEMPMRIGARGGGGEEAILFGDPDGRPLIWVAALLVMLSGGQKDLCR